MQGVSAISSPRIAKKHAIELQKMIDGEVEKKLASSIMSGTQNQKALKKMNYKEVYDEMLRKYGVDNRIIKHLKKPI